MDGETYEVSIIMRGYKREEGYVVNLIIAGAGDAVAPLGGEVFQEKPTPDVIKAWIERMLQKNSGVIAEPLVPRNIP